MAPFRNFLDVESWDVLHTWEKKVVYGCRCRDILKWACIQITKICLWRILKKLQNNGRKSISLLLGV